MKILTNTQSVQIGGITQYNALFQQFLEKNNKEDTHMIGVDVIRKYSLHEELLYGRHTDGQVTIITQEVSIRRIQDVLPIIKSVRDIEDEYQNIIEIFKKIIKAEKPDLIVINGTYFIPWCLYLATKSFSIPIILHYHGIITKETETWNLHSHSLMKQMEQTFDNSRLYYIFPSNLAKEVVENEVFGHQIHQSAILPNPIPANFFDVNILGGTRNVGIVARWTDIKNTDFIKKFAELNQKNHNFFKINMVTDIDQIPNKDIGISKIINLHHPMSAYKLGEFYGIMGTIICPSTFETYGNVPQEAIATRTPVLIGSSMGIAEVFRRMGLGYLITDFTFVEDVFEKVKEVAKLGISDKMRRRFKKTLSPDHVYPQLLNIYKSATR
ncbi:glycosyltransferase family 4 protein [Candidatus Daviesbacteria bacterium]|nr:glycosyltransferase family 4 protein [Candidatus Daviesbacteria bacterium]